MLPLPRKGDDAMKYVCKRILMLLVTMVIVSLLAFAAFELIHGSAAEIMLGTQATPDRVAELEAHITDIDYEKAAQWEKKLRHDVMAHVHTYGELCPKAMPIIHLGATSCYVGDNTDVIIMREGLELVRNKLVQVLSRLADFAREYKALPTLGFTHFQAAQLVTVGKRATLWMNELLMDLEEVEHRIASLKLLGSKGTTGTQASFLELFEGDHEKCRALERKIAAEMGFDAVVPVSGQTYSRKMDYAVLSTLSGIAQSASKFATDLRLLCHLKEVEEPFEKNQIGSSAMPYKRNPMPPSGSSVLWTTRPTSVCPCPRLSWRWMPF